MQGAECLEKEALWRLVSWFSSVMSRVDTKKIGTANVAMQVLRHERRAGKS